MPIPTDIDILPADEEDIEDPPILGKDILSDDEMKTFIKSIPRKDPNDIMAHATDNDHRAWITLRENGFSYNKISSLTGWTVGTIRKFLRNYFAALEAERVKQEDRIRKETTSQPVPMDNRMPNPEPPSLRAPRVDNTVIPPTDDTDVDEYEFEDIVPELEFQADPETMRDHLRKFNEILTDHGISKPNRRSIIASYVDVPSYQTFDGLFNFLTSMKSVRPNIAKIIVERFFGYDMQYKTHQANMRSQYQPQMPQMPGQYPIPPGQQVHPNNPMAQNNQQQYPQPQYPQQPYGYPPQPYYQPQQPSMSREEMLHEIEKARKEERERFEKEQKEKELKAELESLKLRMNQGSTRTPDSVIERRPMLNSEGQVIIDPTTNTPIMEEIISPIEKQDPNSLLYEKLEKLAQSVAQNANRGPSDNERQLEKEQARHELDLKIKEMEKMMELQKSSFMTDTRILELQQQLRDTTEKGMSDDARIATQTIDKQFDLTRQQLGNFHDSMKEIIGLAKVLLGNPPNEQQQKQIQQRVTSPESQEWTEEELAMMK